MAPRFIQSHQFGENEGFAALPPLTTSRRKFKASWSAILAFIAGLIIGIALF